MRVFLCAAMLLVSGGVWAEDPKEEAAKEKKARIQERLIEIAIMKHYLEQGHWPEKHPDVAKYMKNGKEDLIDPWGAPYLYSIQQLILSDKSLIIRPIVHSSRLRDSPLNLDEIPPETKEALNEVLKEVKATIGAIVIMMAAKEHQAQNSMLPAKVTDLVQRLKNGKNGLTDPWGKEYKFEIADLKEQNGTIIKAAYAWTERTMGGKIKIYGSKPDDPKELVVQETKATTQIRAIVQAMKKYYLEHAEWPTKLAEIASRLDNGEKSLIDPWGREYKFEIRQVTQADGTVIETPYVWTERGVALTPLVYGTKPVSKRFTKEEEEANSQARSIAWLLKKYRDENKKWPAKLTDLLQDLKNTKNELLDPWGKEYMFEIIKITQANGKVIEKPYVWTERVVDGKTLVYGEKRDDPKEEVAKEKKARFQARTIELALLKKHGEESGWPSFLYTFDLETDMVDPWRTEYKFKILQMKQPDGTVIVRPHVWTERVVDGTIKVYGRKP